MAIPQHNQHDKLELIKSQVFLLEGKRSVDDDLAFDSCDHPLLFGEEQKLSCFRAEANKLDFGI